MGHAILGFILSSEKPPEEEGRDIVLGMLVVGLVFLSVMVIGEVSKLISHRRRRR